LDALLPGGRGRLREDKTGEDRGGKTGRDKAGKNGGKKGDGKRES